MLVSKGGGRHRDRGSVTCDDQESSLNLGGEYVVYMVLMGDTFGSYFDRVIGVRGF